MEIEQYIAQVMSKIEDYSNGVKDGASPEIMKPYGDEIIKSFDNVDEMTLISLMNRINVHVSMIANNSLKSFEHAYALKGTEEDKDYGDGKRSNLYMKQGYSIISDINIYNGFAQQINYNLLKRKKEISNNNEGIINTNSINGQPVNQNDINVENRPEFMTYGVSEEKNGRHI